MPAGIFWYVLLLYLLYRPQNHDPVPVAFPPVVTDQPFSVLFHAAFCVLPRILFVVRSSLAA